jgi:hypothetical protein
MRFPLVLALGALGGLLVVGMAGAATTPGTCDVPTLPQYPTIQSAIDDVNCTTVHVKIGTYVEQLTIGRSLTLAGSVYHEFSTHLQAPATLVGTNAIIRIHGRKVRVKIKHLGIEGPGPDAGGLVGIRVEKDAILTIRDSSIRAIRQEPLGAGAGFIGIHAGVPSEAQITKLTLTLSRIEDYQSAGVVVEGPGTTAVISQIFVSGDADRDPADAVPAGIVVRGGAYAEITRNDVVDNSHPSGLGRGVLFEDARDGVVVRYNNVDRNDAGVAVVGTHHATLYRNAIDGGGDGIVLGGPDPGDGANSTRVTGNRVTGAAGVGLRLVQSQEGLFTSNELATSGGDGAHVESASALNVFNYNRADTNGAWGIVDASVGTGTAHTANRYLRSNYCNGNALGDSSPAGLCR